MYPSTADASGKLLAALKKALHTCCYLHHAIAKLRQLKINMANCLAIRFAMHQIAPSVYIVDLLMSRLD